MDWNILEFIQSRDIFHSIEIGDDERVALYLISGGDINITKDGISLLVLAIQSRHFTIVKMLVSRGAVLPSFDEIYMGVYWHREIDIECLLYLLEQGIDLTHSLFYIETCETASILLHYGADVNEVWNGDTPLPYLILNFSGDESELICIIEQFLKYGADVNVQDSHGDTSLHLAASKDLWKVMDFLLFEGAEIDIENHVKETFLEVVSNEYFEKRKDYLEGWWKKRESRILEPELLNTLKKYLRDY